jgi:hypothetical protein
MSALSIQPTYPIFTDRAGEPLEAGYIWIGTANLNPITNPISVYWDAALTQPAVQPIRTVSGYPSNAGTPARLYVNSDYSIQVQNKNGTVVYSAPAATERLSSDLVTFIQAGPGAVQRTAQNKMRETVSVKDFGAVGNGVTDDSAAAALAVSYASVNNKKLYWPAGNYLIGTKLTLSSSIYMVGDGDDTILIGVDGDTAVNRIFEIQDNALVVDVDRMSFTSSNYAFYATNGTVIADRFTFNRCQFFSIRHAIGVLDIRDSNISSGTPVSIGVNRFELTECQLKNLTGDAVYSNKTNGAVMVTCRNIGSALIRENVADTGTGRCFQLGNNVYPQSITPHNWGRYVVRDNRISNWISAGSIETQGILLYGNDGVVDGNILTNIYNANYEDSEGIYTKMRFVEISNNILTDCFDESEGGALTAKGAGDTNQDGFVNVHHNIVRFTSAPTTLKTIGIAISTQSEVANNIVQNTGKWGIVVADYGRRHRIINNQIYNNAASIVSPATDTAAIYIFPIPTQPTFAQDLTENKIEQVFINGNNIGACKNRGIYFRYFYGDAIPYNQIISGNVLNSITGDGYAIEFFVGNFGSSPTIIPEAYITENRFTNLVTPVRVEDTTSLSADKIRLTLVDNYTNDITGGFLVSGPRWKCTYGRNFGTLLTQNSGTVSITSGNTETAAISTNITDTAFTGTGLTLNNISVIPTTTLGSATKWWVEVVSGAAGTFKIVLDSNPGTTVSFAWIAQRTNQVERS